MSTLSTWYRQMEKIFIEDFYYLETGGQYLTPRDIVSHANLNDAIWQNIESNNFSIPTRMIKERYIQKYNAGILGDINILAAPYVITPQMQVDAVMAETELGKDLIRQTRNLLEYLLPR